MNIRPLSIDRLVLATVISIVLWSTTGFAQVVRFQDIKKKSIKLSPVDTTEVLIYETRHALLYFAKKDIIDHVASLDEDLRVAHGGFLDVLKKEAPHINIHSDTIYDAIDTMSFMRRPSGKDHRDVLVWVMMDVAADLLLQGKVLPYSKVTRAFETKRIKCRNEAAGFPLDLSVPTGTRLLVFRFRDDVEIYSLVTALGE